MRDGTINIKKSTCDLNVSVYQLVHHVASHGASPQVYWKSVLPKSPMPKAIKDLLHTKAWDDGSVKLITNTTSTYIKLKDHPEQSYPYVEFKDEVKDHLLSPFLIYGMPSDEVKDNPFAQLLFLENHLHQGEEMKLRFYVNDQKTPFLPKEMADSIPFSSKNLSEIYKRFSVKPDSMEGKIMKQALSLCEHKGIDGEEKLCVTSLESMIEFTTTKLGKKVKALSTDVKAKERTASQNYKIELVKKLATNKGVVCHRQDYAYAIFYCHIIKGTQLYIVSLDGEDGTKVKSMAVCHTDTSKWDPKHMAFQVLKVTQGTVPVCHFLSEDVVLWVPY